MTQIRVGISGWTYDGWRGRFYPPGLPRSRELEFASRQLNSIEINGTFYSLQRPKSFESWYAQVPADFLFSVKGNRYITHIRRLNEIERPLANFFASGIFALREKLGPILWQFPPNFIFRPEKLEPFLGLLPRTTSEAARIAKKHDPWMRGRSLTEPDGDRKLRYAIEVRHPSFKNEEFIKLLRKFRVALVSADSAGRFPHFEEVTTRFMYLRMHGNAQLYVSGYDDPELERLAGRIRRSKRDAYVYFDNDVKVRAPFDAARLLQMLTAYEPRAQLPRLPPEAAA